MSRSEHHAYIVGVALGDGNISCPNERALRLRITCDLKYPNLIRDIINSLQIIFPYNKVSIAKRQETTCIDISLYSNGLKDLLPWEFGKGSKIQQDVSVPDWILQDETLSIACLRGLFQTDGSIYYDRSYLMVNFTNVSYPLICDVYEMTIRLGFLPNIYKSVQTNGNIKYVVRLSKDTQSFINKISLVKN